MRVHKRQTGCLKVPEGVCRTRSGSDTVLVRDVYCEARCTDKSLVRISLMVVSGVMGKSEGVPAIGLIISTLSFESRERERADFPLFQPTAPPS